MIFGRTSVADAEGAVLVHSVQVDGTRFKKGRKISADDVDRLAAAGIDDIVTVRFEADDIDENEAASRIAAACSGPGTTQQAAFTGRCNLYADGHGIALIDRERIDALNAIDEAVTIATVSPYDVVMPGQMLATIKIIPFAAPADAVTAAEDIARASAAMVGVAAFTPHRAGLVLTRLTDTKDSVLNKTRAVLAERLAKYGSAVHAEVRCAHAAQDIATAITAQRDAGCAPILVFGASAITDRRDEIPAGIAAAGGTVEHFGMPVDPGNLLLLGHVDDVPVIGLPGCARSPKLNGFDWVLERLLAGRNVTPQDVQRMGVGGLLKEIPTRNQPRRAERDPDAAAPRAPRIAALVLAAGQSRRMGQDNKLLLEVDRKAMVARVVEAALASQAASTIVVTGHQADDVTAALANHDVTFIHNPAYADGLSASLKAGIAAVPDDIDGVVILLGDMPRVHPGQIDKLIAAFNPIEDRAICVPTFNGKRGNPVLVASTLFDEIRDVMGDIGARHLIGAHEDAVAEVPMDDDGVLIDVDTPDALTSLRRNA